MKTARIWVIGVGVVLPYAARLPGLVEHGFLWLAAYLYPTSSLFLQALNAISWGAMLLVSLSYRHPHAMWFPAVPGFGFLAWAHGTLDLAADAQAAIALLIFPFLSLPFIAVGGLIGWGFDRWLGRREKPPT